MKAVILAAGRGSRMKHLTDERPKCLVELRGKSLLQRQIDALQGAGISDIGVVTGYMRHLVARPGLREFHNPRWSETNMVTSLEAADEWLSSEECVVSYSDIFYEAQAVSLLAESQSDLSILYDPGWLRHWQARFSDPLSDAETFRMTVDGRLKEIGGKPSHIDEVQGQYMGLLKFLPAGWANIRALRLSLPSSQRDAMHMTGTLQALIERGIAEIACVPYAGTWGEIDTESDLIVYKSI